MRTGRRAVLNFLTLVFVLVVVTPAALAQDEISGYINVYTEAFDYVWENSIKIPAGARKYQIYQASVETLASNIGLSPPKIPRDDILAQKTALEYLRQVLRNAKNKKERDAILHLATKSLVAKWDPWAHLFDLFDSVLMFVSSGFYENGDGILAKLTRDGKYVVVYVLEDSGAEAAGIKRGDILLEIEGIKINNLTEKTIYELERKARKTGKIKYTISRDSRVFTADVRYSTRENPVVISRIIEGDIAYISLGEAGFIDGVGHEIVDALESLILQGAKSVILDLRGNPGGSSWEAQIAISLFKSGKLYIRKGKNAIDEHYSVIDKPFEDVPLAILVDKNSASAAEKVAFILRDRDKTRIFGENTNFTYGKGVSQRYFFLSNDWIFGFTTGKLFDIRGNSWDGIGVKVTERVDSKRDSSDAVLSRAIEWLKTGN
jgi:carboxyl-terminal processing protease